MYSNDYYIPIYYYTIKRLLLITKVFNDLILSTIGYEHKMKVL